jgi:hypothetical protein
MWRCVVGCIAPVVSGGMYCRQLQNQRVFIGNRICTHCGTSNRPHTLPPLPIGPTTASTPRARYKYWSPFQSSPHFISSLWRWTDRWFRNIGIKKSDAVDTPKRLLTIFKTWRKFEIKNCTVNFTHLIYKSVRRNSAEKRQVIQEWVDMG